MDSTAATLQEIVVARAMDQQNDMGSNNSAAPAGAQPGVAQSRHHPNERRPSANGYPEPMNGPGPALAQHRPADHHESSAGVDAGREPSKGMRTPGKAAPEDILHTPEEDFKFGDLDEEEPVQAKPFYRKFKFWRSLLLWVASFTLIVAGVLLKVLNHESYPVGPHSPPVNGWQRFKISIRNFELWRWLLFFGGLFPDLWVGGFVVRLLAFIVESAFLTTTNVLYFLIAIRKPLANFIRAVLLMALYVPLFSPRAYSSGTGDTIYTNVLKAIGCLILFTFANVLSTLLAKIMASHFHKAAHFSKMQQAIRKEYYLSVLSAPRPGRGPRVPFSSDADLYALDLDSGSSDAEKDRHGSASLGKGGSFPRAGSATPGLSDHLYDTLVAPMAKVLPSGQARAASAPLNFSFHSGDSVAARNAAAEDRRNCVSSLARASAAVPPNQAAPQPPAAAAGAAGSGAAAGSAAGNPVLAQLRPLRAPPIRVAPPVPSPQRPPRHAGNVDADAPPDNPGAARGTKEIDGPRSELKACAEEREGPDSAAEEYYGPGRAEKAVSGRSERSRRRLLSGGGGREPATPRAGEQRVGGIERRSEDAGLSTRSSRRWASSSPFRKDVEQSEGSRSRLLGSGGSRGGIMKWGSLMGGDEKFRPEDVIADTIATSEEPPDLREGAEEKGRNMAARLYAVEKHLRKNPLQGGTFVDRLQRSTSRKGFQAEAERQAKRVAFYIYYNVKPDGARKHLAAQDLEALLPPDQALEAFAMLDVNGDGRLTPRELCEGVTVIFRERSNLATQLKDTKSVVGRLRSVISVVLHIVFIFFYLMIYDVDIQKVWLLFSSVVLAFAFVFGNSIRQLYEAVIYLFVIHPFDVGDWLLFDGINQFQVEEVNLAFTTLRGIDMVRQYYPNTRLLASNLVNLSRSDNRYDILKIPVGLTTPVSVLDELVRRVDTHLRANKGEWTGKRDIAFREITDTVPIRMIILVACQLSHTSSDIGRTLAARSALLSVINQTLQELGVFKDGIVQGIPEGWA